ncbi:MULTISPECIES: hypothetical protein [unclassified Rhodococcus (in: high G+C Gram-positive bacteria)]|uniref:hypothetical protein n=1 Tax=unclassified Rhodococcus (in: high G+C Gram-positive bacteria) TaxID=192944 RepID=UPI0002A3D49C|nr:MULTISPECIES: hypothetical protein [unclassified Rhodococcus (in: high G+C Gram-positive bacteria)]ELB94918.1 hypothetical protein Rwratislav_01387 [Rhodococcus wratislaviensis IFP 2016]MBC2637456.1 hypothetical protein [Rhodococcus sp. 3A]MBC2898187.1 hypothetical protein [Rhodococcus sp. 4CII]
MDRRGTALTKPIELAALEAASLPGVRDVRASPDALRVFFVEADFVIRLSRPAPRSRWDTDWAVSVREASPGLGTWWGEWQRSFVGDHGEVGSRIAEDIRDALGRIRSMLADHSAPGSPSAT